MSKNRFLIIAGNSSIGRKLVDHFKKKKIIFYYTTRNKKNRDKNHFYLDIKSKTNKKIFELNFDILIYCVGITSIEECQNNKNLSRKINIKMTKIFLSKFKNKKKKIVYFSSNKNLNVSKLEYFKQKLEMEKFLIKNFPKQYLVLKLGKIISKDMHLFKKWKKEIKVEKKITVYKNYFFYETKISKLLHFFTNNKNNFKSKTYKLFSIKKKNYIRIAKLFLKELNLPSKYIFLTNS